MKRTSLLYLHENHGKVELSQNNFKVPGSMPVRVYDKHCSVSLGCAINLTDVDSEYRTPLEQKQLLWLSTSSWRVFSAPHIDHDLCGWPEPAICRKTVTLIQPVSNARPFKNSTCGKILARSPFPSVASQSRHFFLTRSFGLTQH